jgi:hypothetical protein
VVTHNITAPLAWPGECIEVIAAEGVILPAQAPTLIAQALITMSISGPPSEISRFQAHIAVRDGDLLWCIRHGRHLTLPEFVVARESSPRPEHVYQSLLYGSLADGRNLVGDDGMEGVFAGERPCIVSWRSGATDICRSCRGLYIAQRNDKTLKKGNGCDSSNRCPICRSTGMWRR